jgi:hypothetical protein
MATAGIGALIKSILAGGSAASGGGGAAASALGGVGAAGAGVAAAGLAGAAAIGYMGYNSIEKASDGYNSGMQAAGSIVADAKHGGSKGKQRAIDALGQARKNDNALNLIQSVASLGFNTAKSVVTGQNDSFDGIRKYSEARGIMSKEKEISDAIVDKPAITQALTAAITEGIKAGVANAASPDSPSRSVPMQSRQ